MSFSFTELYLIRHRIFLENPRCRIEKTLLSTTGGCARLGPSVPDRLAKLDYTFYSIIHLFFRYRTRLYLRPSLRIINPLRPTIIKSLNLLHILIITDLEAWLRIVQSLAFLPLGTDINCVLPSVVSNNGVVARALRSSPSIWLCGPERKSRFLLWTSE